MRTKRVMDAIEDYLSQHPDAADSAQGIAKWWLPAMGLDVTAQEITDALERLRDLGLIEEKSVPGGEVIYRASDAGRHRADKNERR